MFEPAPIYNRPQPTPQQQRPRFTNLGRVSLPMNNLFEISLVRDNTNNFRPICIMVSMVPGIQDSTSPTGRRYDMNQRITLMFTVHELFSLAAALKLLVEGRIRDYVKWSDTTKIQGYQGAGLKKSFRVTADPNNPGKFFLGAETQGTVQSKCYIVLNYDDILGLSMIVEQLAKRALDLTFELTKDFNGTNVQPGQQPVMQPITVNQPAQNVPPAQNIPPVQNVPPNEPVTQPPVQPPVEQPVTQTTNPTQPVNPQEVLNEVEKKMTNIAEAQPVTGPDFSDVVEV